ncbi:MAG: hypothetical protein KAR42_06565 [candidate division Zixibacteria bacterium]|nr:hypothetical protein [candidate division Zixibacteria bacterium]
MKVRVGIIVSVGLLASMLIFSGCQQPKQHSPEEIQLMKKCEELFNRTKIYDYEVIYENEFPYLHEKMDMEEYLLRREIQYSNLDTLLAVQIDSATLWTDTAFVYMQLEWALSAQTRYVQPINLRWYFVNDQWIKPTFSAFDQQQLFEEELRIYWEAVEDIKAREREGEETE